LNTLRTYLGKALAEALSTYYGNVVVSGTGKNTKIDIEKLTRKKIKLNTSATAASHLIRTKLSKKIDEFIET